MVFHNGVIWFLTSLAETRLIGEIKFLQQFVQRREELPIIIVPHDGIYFLRKMVDFSTCKYFPT